MYKSSVQRAPRDQASLSSFNEIVAKYAMWNMLNPRTRASLDAHKSKERVIRTEEIRQGMERARRVAGNNLLHPTTCCTPLKILHASPSNFTVNCLFGKKSLSFSVFVLSPLFSLSFSSLVAYLIGCGAKTEAGRLDQLWELVVSRTGRNWEEVNERK